MKSTKLKVPVVINGQEIFCENEARQVVCAAHKESVCTFHKADATLMNKVGMTSLTNIGY